MNWVYLLDLVWIIFMLCLICIVCLIGIYVLALLVHLMEIKVHDPYSVREEFADRLIHDGFNEEKIRRELLNYD